MLEHIPAGVNPSGYEAELHIEENRDAIHLNAADEHAALMEAIASYAKNIITKYEDVRSTDVRYKIESESFGVGAMIIGVPEKAPALPDFITELVEIFRGNDYVELRAEGFDISPDYDMPSQDYKYVFHYGN